MVYLLLSAHVVPYEPTELSGELKRLVSPEVDKQIINLSHQYNGCA